MNINKLFLRWIAVFGIMAIFSVSGYGAAKADLRLTKSASVAIVNESSAMSYTITVENLSGSTNALGITVTDTLQNGMSFISSSGSGWSCSSAGSPVVITCTMAELAKNTSSTLTLNVTAPTSAVSGAVTFPNSATVATTGTDDDVPANNIGSVTVTLNRLPVAVNDDVSTASHTAVSGNVLSNDSDLDGDSITVTNPGTFTLAFGQIEINSDGTYTYTPGYFTGETDHYTYTVSDGHGGTSSAELLINIGSSCTETGNNNTDRSFCLRKQTVLFGDMVTIGNTVIVPPNPQPASTTNKLTYCSTYTTGSFSTDTNNIDNQGLFLCSYRPDSYLNATSAQLITTGKIKWAGLYLQGVVKSSETASLSSMDVKIKKDGSSYVSAGNPTVINHKSYVTTNSINYDNYSAFIDVTQVITSQNWQGGVYTVANVPVTTDALVGNAQVIGKYGAWSLVVIYEDTNLPLKSVSIYDGWKKITGTDASSSATINVGNFYTPTTGSIDSTVSIFVGEGDKYREGDHLYGWVPGGAIAGKYLGTQDNAFNAGIVSTGSRTPSLSNNQGIDIKTYQIGNGVDQLLSNSDNNISFKFSTDGDIDYHYPSMLAFSTEVYHPRMCYYEDIYSASGKLGTGTLIPKGSPLQVRVLLQNDMEEPAENVLFYREFNSSLPYSAGSTGYVYNNSTPVTMASATYSVTDALNAADNFDYSPPLNLFSMHAGNNATYTLGGDFVANQTALIDFNTTANFDGNTSFVYQIAYTMPTIGFRYEGELAKCVDFNNTFGVAPSIVYPVGNMDVIEASSYAQPGPSYADANKNIFTKIVKKPFDLEVVYLDDAGIEKAYNGTIGTGPNPKIMNMAVLLYTTDTDTCTEERQMIWRGQLLHGASHVTANIDDVDVDGGDEEKGFTITKAAKDQRIKVNFIDYGTLINAATDLTCSTSSLDSSLCLVPACLNSDDQIKKAFPLVDFPHVSVCLYGDGSANAAPCDSNAYNGSCGGKTQTIRPAKYDNDIGCAMCLADALGMNGCSSDNFGTRPNDFNSTITLNQQFVAAQPVALTFSANQFGGAGTLDYNETEHTSFVVDVNISDSTKNCQDMNISFSPNINFTNGQVSGNYALGNVGDFNVTMHETVGSEYALVDTDDSSDTIRLITPFTTQIKVIPHHFALDGNWTNGSNGFTYLSNFEGYPTAESRSVSALVDFNITAKASDDSNTTNYTESCYAKDGNLTLTLGTALVVTPAGSLSKMLWYDTNHDVNGSIALGGTSYVFSTFASQFDSTDANGTAAVKYRVNFDRNKTKIVDSFVMDVTNIDYDDSDSVSANPSFAPTEDINYLYGRIIPRDARVFGTTVPAIATGWFEVFNSPTVDGISLPPSKNSTQWYINTLHTDLTDGDAYVTQLQTGGAGSTQVVPPVGNASVAGVVTYNFGNRAIGSYKAHIDTQPWLWYGINANDYIDPNTGDTEVACLTHPCFNINVVPNIGTAGSATSTGLRTDKTNKATSTGTGVTYDYTPATR